MSLVELAELLAKLTHTLMTAEELKERMSAGIDMETAHVLSIDKWERALKPENWDELVKHPITYLNGCTCALCRFLHDNPIRTSCSSCPLYLNEETLPCSNADHPWQRASVAVRNGDREAFECCAKELLKIMRNALDELRRPKRTYRIGQKFRYSGAFQNGGLYILSCVEPRKILGETLGVALTNLERGYVWTAYGIPVLSSAEITEDDFAKIANGSPNMFTPVEVEITEKGMKK